MTTQNDFWKRYREITVKNVNRLGYIHAAEANKLVMETFHLRSVPDLWAWKKAHRSAIGRNIRKALRPLGLRIKRKAVPVGYMLVEKIAA